MWLLYLTRGLVFVSLFDQRTFFSSTADLSASISVLELKLLTNSNSDVSKISSGFVIAFVGTLPFSFLIKSSCSDVFASWMAWRISVSVMWPVICGVWAHAFV